MSWQDRQYRDYGGGGPFGGGSFGGMGIGLPRPTPVVRNLLIANFAVYLLVAVTGREASFLYQWGLMFPSDVLHGQVWRLITYQYLHATDSVWHILMNMLGVYFLGPPLERSWGGRRFFFFYTVGGMIGAALYLLLSSVGVLIPGGMVGASGSVLAILGACALLFPQIYVILFIFPVPIRVAATIFCAVFLLSIVAGRGNAGGDAAHLGGLAFGVLWPLYGQRWLNNLRDLRRYSREKNNAERAQRTQQEVDRILRKVHDEGLHSLSTSEKRTLNEATRRSQAERTGIRQ